MAIAAGQLRDRVTIQQKTSVRDAQGGRAVTWDRLTTVWARVQPLRASEALQAAAVRASVLYRVTVRYRADIQPTMRLLWIPFRASTAKTLEIQGVTPENGGREFLALSCAEVL